MSAYIIKLDSETMKQLRVALEVALPDSGQEVPLAFDEAYYLEANPDVRAAVEDKIFRSGYEHYTKHGKAEGRSPTRKATTAQTWMPDGTYPSRADLVAALTANRFTNAVMLDGASVFDGFGPALQYWSWPDFMIRSRKPDAPEMRSSYGSVSEMLKHAKQIEWPFAIVVDGTPVKTGFEADGGASQYETVNGVIVRAR